MSISSRIHDTIEGWQAEWKDRLRGWLEAWAINSINGFLAGNESEAINLVKDNLDIIRDDPDTPAPIRDLLDKLTAGAQPLPVLLLIPIAVLMLIPTLTAIAQPLGRILNYKQERIFKSARMDPLSVITAWRRFGDKYAGLFDDLKDQGWSDDRVDALKDVTLFYPAPADLVRWQAREVFEPDMVTKYGLDDELGNIQREPFYKAGMTDEQITNYWRAHWEHASWMQIVEMLHRGLITEADVQAWFRLVEVPPFWRQLLINQAYTWPTRVDVRRWWDMRTINEAELRRLYSGMGYRGANLDNYMLWTKVYTDFPVLLARWKNGWITLDEVRQRLVALGMPADRVEDMIQEKIAVEEPARIEDGKKLTKSEIYKGVKKGVITPDQGIELLMELKLSRAEAEYLMEINVEVLEGSPETFEEFKKLTDGYNKAVKMDDTKIPDEVRHAADELVKIKLEVDALEKAEKAERRLLVAAGPVPDAASAKLKGIQVAMNRARSELQRIELDYNAKVAQWKHGAG